MIKKKILKPKESVYFIKYEYANAKFGDSDKHLL